MGSVTSIDTPGEGADDAVLAAATRRAIDRFRVDGRSPVIEADGDTAVVTLVRRPGAPDGETLVVGGFVQGGYSARVLPRHGDVEARTWRLPADHLGTYLFWTGEPGLHLPEEFEQLLPVIYGPGGRPAPDPGNDALFEYPWIPRTPGRRSR